MKSTIKTTVFSWLKNQHDYTEVCNKRYDPSVTFTVTDNQSSSFGKIAIYIDLLQGYGADKTLLKIAEGLAQLGVDVDLVTASSFY